MEFIFYLAASIPSNCMKARTIHIEQARRMAIGAQGLHCKSAFGRGKQGILCAIRQIGYVQIDTISVVERAHHHVLWSRLPDYRKKHLRILQKDDRKIIEHWSHALSYLPVEDYRYTLPIKRYFREHRDPWPKSDPKIKSRVLERILNEGPLMARDFKATRNRKGDGWWDWKPAKLALERLFFEGKLVVTHREKFQKVYDLADRALPEGINCEEPSRSEYARFLIRRTIHAHGFASAASMSYQRKGMGNMVKDEIEKMLHEEHIIPMYVKGVDAVYYTTIENLEHIPRVRKKVRFLSPFDNLVIQRERLLDLFGFDYQIECYVPKVKRKYGYFSLPVLYGTEMIGRADMKAERKRNILHIKNLVLEDGARFDDRLIHEFAEALVGFMRFQGAATIKWHQCQPQVVRSALEKKVESFF